MSSDLVSSISAGSCLSSSSGGGRGFSRGTVPSPHISRGHDPSMLKMFVLITVVISLFSTVTSVFDPMVNESWLRLEVQFG
jgi:hypothetical protein